MRRTSERALSGTVCRCPRSAAALTVFLAWLAGCAAPARSPSDPEVVQVAPPSPVSSAAPVVEAPRVAAPADAAADVSVVNGARQRPLGSAAVSFARYLNAMHNRVHPLFSDRYLAWLDRQPTPEERLDSDVVVRVEMAVAPDGHLARIGVVRSSGHPGFDAAGVYAFSHASPFAPTPPEIRSTDGNLWVEWDLHRDPKAGCSTMHARPFLLDR